MTNEGEYAAQEPTSYGLQPPNGGVPPQASAFQPTEVVSDPSAGRLLGGRYRLAARLGHGGMGTVWRAHDEVVDRDVAVKEPRVPENLSERERQTLFERMRREARAAARIDHPAVVSVYDVVMEDGRPWIVMELVRGRSLGDQLTEGTLDPREVARVGVAVLGALAAAHEAGILHRDVKPDNVLLGRYERVVLTDFGIAQIEGEQGLTETGAFVGSPEFISPERVLGQRPGPESDLWSLGVVLYAAVEGVSPYRRQTTPATLQAVLSAEPAAPARGSGALGSLIMQLLRKDPAARPPAAEIRQQLESVARPVPLAPTMVASAQSAAGDGGLTARVASALPRRRGPRLGVLGGALAVAAALVLLFANPFTTDDAPEGWKTYAESERVKASLAVPDNYKRSADEDSVTYTDPGQVHTISIWRETGIKGTALRNANEALDSYKENSYYEDQNADGAVKEADYQGKKAATFDVAWTDMDADPEERNRDLRFVYVNANNIKWSVSVDGPGKGDASRESERIFREVVKYLEIEDL